MFINMLHQGQNQGYEHTIPRATEKVYKLMYVCSFRCLLLARIGSKSLARGRKSDRGNSVSRRPRKAGPNRCLGRAYPANMIQIGEKRANISKAKWKRRRCLRSNYQENRPHWQSSEKKTTAVKSLYCTFSLSEKQVRQLQCFRKNM